MVAWEGSSNRTLRDQFVVETALWAEERIAVNTESSAETPES